MYLLSKLLLQRCRWSPFKVSKCLCGTKGCSKTTVASVPFFISAYYWLYVWILSNVIPGSLHLVECELVTWAQNYRCLILSCINFWFFAQINALNFCLSLSWAGCTNMLSVAGVEGQPGIPRSVCLGSFLKHGHHCGLLSENSCGRQTPHMVYCH